MILGSTVLTEEDISYICTLIFEAGDMACYMREGVSIHEKTGPDDKVTAADKALSKLIVNRLTKRFSGDRIISEEEDSFTGDITSTRLWLVDPIDGTENYIANDGQYSVMIGLLINLKPVFGFVYAPATKTTYYGGPNYGVVCLRNGLEQIRLDQVPELKLYNPIRVIMGNRDRKKYPWIQELPNVRIVKSGSIGIKVIKIIEGSADLYVHFDAKLKTWDTAGPIGIALGGGLEVGSLTKDEVLFPESGVLHKSSIVIGRPGSLNWSNQFLMKH